MGDMAKVFEERASSVVARVLLLLALAFTALSVSMLVPEATASINWVCGVLAGWKVVARS